MNAIVVHMRGDMGSLECMVLIYAQSGFVMLDVGFDSETKVNTVGGLKFKCDVNCFLENNGFSGHTNRL